MFCGSEEHKKFIKKNIEDPFNMAFKANDIAVEAWQTASEAIEKLNTALAALQRVADPLASEEQHKKITAMFKEAIKLADLVVESKLRIKDEEWNQHRKWLMLANLTNILDIRQQGVSEVKHHGILLGKKAMGKLHTACRAERRAKRLHARVKALFPN